MNPVIDVEDLSMMLMALDNGVLCVYQQCHYAPDGWRNYTIIGTEGRIENFGDDHNHTVIRLWNRRTDYNPYGDEQFYVGKQLGRQPWRRRRQYRGGVHPLRPRGRQDRHLGDRGPGSGGGRLPGDRLTPQPIDAAGHPAGRSEGPRILRQGSGVT